MTEAEEKPKAKPVQMLMTALDFTEDDLEANQNGELSEKQRQKLLTRRKNWLTGAALVVFIAAILSFLALIQALDTPLGQQLNIVGFICIVAAGVIIYFARNWMAVDRTLAKIEIELVEGRVVLDVYHRQNSITYSAEIDRTRFWINKEAFLAFKNGDPYVIYYLESPRTLLSAEWLYQQELRDD